MSSKLIGVAQSGRPCDFVASPSRLSVGPASAGRFVGDLGHLAAVVVRMGDEVLEDHLLDVPVALVDRGQRLERGDPLLLGLADADEDAARERDPELAGSLDRPQPLRRVLARGAGVHGLHQALRDRLEHQPLRGGHLAQPSQVLALQDAEVRVRQEPALQRALARPGHVGDEVLVAPGPKSLGDLGMDLGPLAREHEQLLGVAAHRLVEPALHLIGLVQVRPMGREGAVLAVAAAGA